MGGLLRRGALGLVCLALFSLPVTASETVTHTYDALGRMVTVARSGSVNNGISATTSYDAAGNRTNETVTGVAPTSAQLSIGNASVTEGGTLSFTVTRSGITTSAVSASYATSDGTAAQPGDYTAASGTVSFAANQTTATVSVTTIDDATVESAETMTVTLSSPSSGATITGATGTGTINDNDVAAQLAIGNASVTEGGTLSFTVTRSGNTSIAASASYASSDDTAAQPGDYTATSGTVSFAASQTTATIPVTTIDDATVESAETMSVTLSSPSSGATITTAAGTGTINDNDGWSSSLTAGSTSCGWTCTEYGYEHAGSTLGAMSNTAYNGYTITQVASESGSVFLKMEGSSAAPNSGWTSITIPGVGTLNRASATYSTNHVAGKWIALWTWSSTSTVTSGTVMIQ